jgi:hypothetical protein
VALRMFALWWLATGLNILMGSGFIAAAALGWTDLRLQLSYAVLQRLLLAMALAGLVYYLLFLVRGRAPLASIIALYMGYFALLVGILYASEPVGVYVGGWRTDLLYARHGVGAPWLPLLSGLALVLPPVALSIAAMAVARRLPPRHPQRNRLLLVGCSLVAWWIVAAVAGQQEAFGHESFQVFNRFLGLSMALVVLAAYRSPAWLRRFIETPRDEAAPVA